MVFTSCDVISCFRETLPNSAAVSRATVYSKRWPEQAAALKSEPQKMDEPVSHFQLLHPRLLQLTCRHFPAHQLKMADPPTHSSLRRSVSTCAGRAAWPRLSPQQGGARETTPGHTHTRTDGLTHQVLFSSCRLWKPSMSRTFLRVASVNPPEGGREVHQEERSEESDRAPPFAAETVIARRPLWVSRPST